MRKFFYHSLWASILFVALPAVLYAQSPAPDPWQPDQLIAPSIFVTEMKFPEKQRPVLIDIGPAGTIPGALVAEPAHEKEGFAKLQKLLKNIPRDKEVVIYCGCCPFDHCPNVRPAFKLLLDMGFTHPRLLDLSHNLKQDWIDKGYPILNE